MTERQLILGLAIGVLVVCLFGLAVGPSGLDFSMLYHALTGESSPIARLVILDIRLPRVFAALLVGSALGFSGAAMQGLMRNPLAEPGILGVSTTASLFATLTLFFGLIDQWQWTIPVAAICGALLATIILASIAVRAGSIVNLILVGVGISSIAGGLISLMVNLAPNPISLSEMITWMMGSVANKSFKDIGIAAPFITLGCLLIWWERRALSAFTLGEETATAIGLDVSRARLFIIIGTGLAVGGTVALAGAIGFVGLIAPHMVRRFVDYEPSRTPLPAGLLGGLILVLADIFIRLIPSTNELNLGVLIALIGAPLFIWIAASRGNTHD